MTTITKAKRGTSNTRVSRAAAHSLPPTNVDPLPTPAQSTPTQTATLPTSSKQAMIPTATTSKAVASPSSNPSSSQSSNLKIVATAAAANTKQMLTALETIQSNAVIVVGCVNELKAEQAEMKEMLSLIIEKLHKIETSPPKAPTPRSRHFTDVI